MFLFPFLLLELSNINLVFERSTRRKTLKQLLKSNVDYLRDTSPEAFQAFRKRFILLNDGKNAPTPEKVLNGKD